MNFQRVGQWGHVSDCGRYTISMMRAGSGFRFEAWRRRPGDMPKRVGDGFGSLELATAACEADAQAKRPAQAALL